jgi:Skp family chaperone for outer membrane proteins
MDLRGPLPTRERARQRLSSLSILCLVVLLGSVASATLAQGTAPKIAVVDLERVFLESSLGTEFQTSLRALEEQTRKQIEALAQRAQDLEAQIPEVQDADERRNLMRQREDQELQARRIRDDANRQAAKLEQEKQVEFNTKMEPLFDKLQQEQSFDLILNKVPGVVIYAGSAFDITETVIQRLAQGG